MVVCSVLERIRNEFCDYDHTLCKYCHIDVTLHTESTCTLTVFSLKRSGLKQQMPLLHSACCSQGMGAVQNQPCSETLAPLQLNPCKYTMGFSRST